MVFIVSVFRKVEYGIEKGTSMAIHPPLSPFVYRMIIPIDSFSFWSLGEMEIVF